MTAVCLVEQYYVLHTWDTFVVPTKETVCYRTKCYCGEPIALAGIGTVDTFAGAVAFLPDWLLAAQLTDIRDRQTSANPFHRCFSCSGSFLQSSPMIFEIPGFARPG